MILPTSFCPSSFPSFPSVKPLFFLLTLSTISHLSSVVLLTKEDQLSTLHQQSTINPSRPLTPPVANRHRSCHQFGHCSQWAAGWSRNSSSAMPWPPTSNWRLGLNCLAKASRPGNDCFRRPLLTSMETVVLPWCSTKSTSRFRSRQ